MSISKKYVGDLRRDVFFIYYHILSFIFYFMMLGGLLFLLTGCSGSTTGVAGSASGDANPTPHPALSNEGNLRTPVAGQDSSSLFTQKEMPTLVPTPTRFPSPTVNPTTPTPIPARFRDLTIYDDQLDANWTLENSFGVAYDAESTSTVYTGTAAISVVPEVDFGSFFFTVAPESTQEYLRSEVLGIRFMLNSGDDYLALEDMALSVWGSNELPYWSADDNSVEFPIAQESFSETRLYFLGINKDIPPNTWVEAELWMDQLVFDPDYVYLTGFRLKHGGGYRTNYYIDNVALIFAEPDVDPEEVGSRE
ncbi:MAG: hypothetical protein ACPGWR_13590 [Ardenticatenaceae bacterium]